MPVLTDMHCSAGATLLDQATTDNLLNEVYGWQDVAQGNAIQREFRFKDYKNTMQFVNKVAAIAENQDHHPDMLVSYNRCVVTYITHSRGGLTENDFICAALVNQAFGE